MSIVTKCPGCILEMPEHRLLVWSVLLTRRGPCYNGANILLGKTGVKGTEYNYLMVSFLCQIFTELLFCARHLLGYSGE